MFMTYVIILFCFFASAHIENLKLKILGQLSNFEVVEIKGKEVIQNITLEMKKVEISVQEGIRSLAPALMAIFLINIYYFLYGVVNMLYRVYVAGQKFNIFQYVNGMIAPLLLLFIVNKLFQFTLIPSTQYTKLLDELHHPNLLWSISKCYGGASGGSTDFYAVMEHQRKRLIWVLFGVPISAATYHKVMGALASAMVTSMAVMVRGSVM